MALLVKSDKLIKLSSYFHGVSFFPFPVEVAQIQYYKTIFKTSNVVQHSSV